MSELTIDDAAFIIGEMKLSWKHDRAHKNFPTCNIYERVYADDNVDTPTMLARFVNVPCSYSTVTEELAAGTGGFMNPGDIRVVLYEDEDGDDLPKLEDEWVIEVSGERWTIESQKYSQSSKRNTLICRPFHDD